MPRHLQLSLATTALLIGASLAGCGAEPFTEPTLISEPPTLVAAVSVTPAADTLRALGEVRRLVATARDKTGAPILGGAFTWRSSDENVLSVSSDGQISAMGNGSAVVTAGTEGVAGSATILVRQEPAQLGFTMLPTSVEAGAVIVPGLEVEVRDALGTRVRGATTRVTLSLEVTQCLGTLLGNLAANAEDGIAHFPDLMIDRAGRGFVLGARASGLTLALSRSFDVRAAPDTPPLRICIVDPAGDQTGQIDVLGMVMGFDPVTGGYQIELLASEQHPFRDTFRVNVNLFNPDVGTAAQDPSFLSDALNDYTALPPVTRLVVWDSSPRLAAWREGHRVFTNSLSGTGNPNGVSLFRSAVSNFPMGFLTNEDVIAFAVRSQAAVVERVIR